MNNYGFIKVALASPKVSPCDCSTNVSNIKIIMNQANESKSSVLVLPELSITGYTCGDMFFQQALLASSLDGLLAIREHSKDMDMLTVVGMPLQLDNSLYNVMVVVLN
jgi:NAD+ synthase (glutamine-hydrolysing)